MLHRRDPRSGLWVPSARLYIPGTWAPHGAGGLVNEAFSVTDLGDQTATASGGTATFTFGDFGGQALNRRLVALLTLRSSAVTVTGVTIGGVGGAVHVQSGASAVAINSIICSAIVPSGTAGDVVITCSSNPSNTLCCTLVRLTGTGTGSTPFHTNSAEDAVSDSSISCTLNRPAGGVVLAVSGQGGTNDHTHSLANLLTNQDAAGSYNMSAAYEVFGSAATGMTITVTRPNNNAVKSMAAISFDDV